MQTVLNRRLDDDSHDGFEIYQEKFHGTPSFVFRAGGLSEDPYIDEDNISKKSILSAQAELGTLRDSLIEKLKEIYGTWVTDDTKWWINGVGGVATLHLINQDHRIVIRILHFLTKRSKNICVYAPAPTEQLTKFCEYLVGLYPRRKPKENIIKIISQDSGNFYMTSVDIKKRVHSFDLENYNDDFAPVSKRIVSDLKKQNDSGLVLLHGDVGTGKTTFLKYLLQAVGSKEIVYVPPDLTHSLSAPSFMTFLINEAKNSILLIEDAENVLKHRESGGSQAVSNILNISDGILGDILQLQIVCTFNCPIEELDVALRRPGRLIAEYEFKRLSADKTKALMAKINGADAVYSKREMSLAEIYNHSKMPEKSNPEKDKVFGFT